MQNERNFQKIYETFMFWFVKQSRERPENVDPQEIKNYCLEKHNFGKFSVPIEDFVQKILLTHQKWYLRPLTR